MDERTHYLCRIQVNGIVFYVVWYTDVRDGFVRDASGRLHAAFTAAELSVAVGTEGTSWVDDGLTDYDFDRIAAWCADPTGAAIDCPAFLNAWNFFDDLAALHDGGDSRYTGLSRSAGMCYDKLFFACNLLTPPGNWFEPEWRVEEMSVIRRVLKAGIALLESELQVAGVNGLPG